MKLQAPPEIDILKALSLVANGKIKTDSSGSASIEMQGGKKFVLYFDGENNIVDCDESLIKDKKMSAVVLAFLMLQNIIPYENNIGTKLKGVKWENLIGTDEAIIQNIIRPWSMKDKTKLKRYVMWVSEMIKDISIKTSSGAESLRDYGFTDDQV